MSLISVIKDQTLDEAAKLAEVTRLLDLGEGINQVDERGCTPLHLTIRKEYTAITALLITRGADLKKMNQEGYTPFFMTIAAASYAKNEVERYVETLRLMIEQGAEVNQVNQDQDTPLHVAASQRYLIKVVELLLAHGAEVNKLDKEGFTPLENAHSNLEMTKLLLAHGAKLTLLAAVQVGDLETVRHMLETRKEDINQVDASGHTPLFFAVKNRHIDMINLLIQAGVDLNKTSDYFGAPLHEAAWNGDLELVRILLDAGANVNQTCRHSNETPLGYAACEGHTAVVKMLLQRGAEVNTNVYKTALCEAVEAGNLEMAQLLVAVPGIDANRYGNATTKAPLWSAAAKGDIAMAELLLTVPGIEIDQSDYKYRTALHWAVMGNASGMVELLIKHGADIYKKNQEDKSPLELASEALKQNMLSWVAQRQKQQYRLVLSSLLFHRACAEAGLPVTEESLSIPNEIATLIASFSYDRSLVADAEIKQTKDEVEAETYGCAIQRKINVDLQYAFDLATGDIQDRLNQAVLRPAKEAARLAALKQYAIASCKP